MAPTDDLKAHAASSQDFYALLDISPAAAETEIRRAYRRTALKYHPDKIANPTPADIDKFHLLQIAYDVLSEPAVRQLYDNAREARERKRRETDLMDAAKRKMKEDLEARERAGDASQRGVKRSWMSTGMGGGGGLGAADDDTEAKLEREIQRIAEDGRRRRREAEEKILKEAEEEKLAQQEEKAQDRSSQRVDRSKDGGTNVPELERAVKVQWVREGRGLDLDKDRLIALFEVFGSVENAFMLKDKRQRIGAKREKKAVATGVVVFTSIVNAHSAVLDSEKKRKAGVGDWTIVDSVFWASGNKPDLEMRDGHSSLPRSSSVDGKSARPSTPLASHGSIPNGKAAFDFSSLKDRGTPSKGVGKPSFASFSPAAANAKKRPSSPFAGEKPSPSTPSLEEVTLMRLKNAQREKERKALEEQLRREDEAADAAAASTNGT
jgi:DnaJ family protein C protein 17